jgi:hypothetical protein|tara:strand:- start:328 stop:594 length:267 start_codon:yes stop_codon:yes gene_type:complete
MVVNGKANINVDISNSELVDAVKSAVYEKLDIPSMLFGDVYLKNNRWVINKVVATSHSFEMEEDFGEATQDQIEVFTAYHTLAEFLKD